MPRWTPSTFSATNSTATGTTPSARSYPSAAIVHEQALSASRDIPFNKLVLSQANVRRVKAGVSLEDLAEDIARRTLLQGLGVRPQVDGEGRETGMFEVPAGGRRYRALELLVKQKRLARTAPVPCIVRDLDSDASAEEDSLAENVQRAPLHPLDQFRAFQTLRDQGIGEDEIAARFFVAPSVVRQRLRLASVSPVLHEIYAEDGMTLEQLMAFSVSSDHARQEQVWDAVQRAYSQDAYRIRRMLTESTVRASDRRAKFVGIEACTAAGGGILRDLFQYDDGGWLDDAALLDRLTEEKLKAAAEAIAVEGWRWIEIAVDHPYGYAHGLRKLEGVAVEPTAEEAAEIEALNAEYARPEGEYEGADELPDEIDARLGEIETALATLESRPFICEPGEVAIAGVFVGIDADGTLLVDRGYVRPTDEPPVVQEPDGAGGGVGAETDTGSDTGASPYAGDGAPANAEPSAPVAPRVVITVAGRAEPEEDADDAIRPLSERLVAELTAHRTLALRDAVASNPHVAMTALLHKLVVDTFRPAATVGCLDASVRHVFFAAQAADLKDSPPAKAIAERNEAWKHDLPEDDEAALWNWLVTLDEASRMALLAHCVSYGVNAVHEKVDRYGGSGLTRSGLEHRLADADRLARAVGLDMVEAGWAPTVDTYLGRVTRRHILDAVREARGEQAAQLIDHLKKAEMAREAERLLEGSGWLPEPLRLADDSEAAEDSSGETDALPAFLAGDGGDESGEVDDPSAAGEAAAPAGEGVAS